LGDFAEESDKFVETDEEVSATVKEHLGLFSDAKWTPPTYDSGSAIDCGVYREFHNEWVRHPPGGKTWWLGEWTIGDDDQRVAPDRRGWRLTVGEELYFGYIKAGSTGVPTAEYYGCRISFGSFKKLPFVGEWSCDQPEVEAEYRKE